ncbi:MAG: T9SS type A sorting domain-containing protein [Bacteroidota bacterium]|nr:T9SS type A sorting domain-containing protein [Bacteroidota bacterium]MDP4231799.1 T9SS type A sorting domain-containing protein [Bacteroidota bacterium]MDP4242685.1 T9SS type A sorting domain-containing protein [Bacteroidota bacterium]MDP4287136.1 T9SS type A sorting domain-containing protein [Bacteroidota bacterium]
MSHTTGFRIDLRSEHELLVYFAHKIVMFRKLGLCVLMVLFTQHCAQAQTACSKDSLLLSLMPVIGSMQWHCYYPRDTFGTWDLAFGPGAIDWDSDSCSRTSGGDTIIFNIWGGPSSYHRSLLITIDTLRQEVRTFNFSEGVSNPPHQAYVDFNHKPYQIVGSKKHVSVELYVTWYSPDCQNGSSSFSGWLTLGGASPPASVSQKQAPINVFRAIAAPDNSIRFSFETHAEATSIRIFDLLGRERDVISIAPGSESYEYNSAHLTPGMYVARLGGNAVMFVVR